MVLALVALVLFCLLLVYAASTDIASLTIPNWVSLALTGAYPPLALFAGADLATIGMHVLFGFGVLAVGFALFQANIIGGGDAKLLAAAAVWTGVSAFVPFAFWTALAGGVLAIVLLLARKYTFMLAAAPPFVFRLLTPKTGLPYGVAILIGAIMACPSVPLFAPLFSGALTLP